MNDRYADPIPAILMEDRGYESFNTFAHLIRKGMYFVIRMKDINSNGILSAYDLPDSKYDGILQEINARMILYNYCELVTAHAVVKTSKNTKHVYKINFATAVNICRAYLKHGGDETETMLLIQRYLTPVRYNRKYPINLRPKRKRDFMYRAA